MLPFQGEHSAILLTFIKLPFVIKIFVLSIFEWPFYAGFTVLSNHKMRHFYLNLAELLTYNHHCMMYYMKLCNVEYSTWCTDNFKPSFTMIIFSWLEIWNFPMKIGKKDTFGHWKYNRKMAIKSAKNKPWYISRGQGLEIPHLDVLQPLRFIIFLTRYKKLYFTSASYKRQH